MPKFGVNIDANYRRLADRATDVRCAIRQTIHRPEKRATTRTLFAIGVASLLVAGATVGFLR